jgi:hypothetical protein
MISRKAQYEKKFKEWGFKKNHTKEDWRIVGYKVGQRKRAAKESNVYLDHELMPRKKLQKEISRQGYMSFTEQFNQAHREYSMRQREDTSLAVFSDASPNTSRI